MEIASQLVKVQFPEEMAQVRKKNLSESSLKAKKESQASSFQYVDFGRKERIWFLANARPPERARG